MKTGSRLIVSVILFTAKEQCCCLLCLICSSASVRSASVQISVFLHYKLFSTLCLCFLPPFAHKKLELFLVSLQNKKWVEMSGLLRKWLPYPGQSVARFPHPFRDKQEKYILLLNGNFSEKIWGWLYMKKVSANIKENRGNVSLLIRDLQIPSSLGCFFSIFGM